MKIYYIDKLLKIEREILVFVMLFVIFILIFVNVFKKSEMQAYYVTVFFDKVNTILQ